MFDHFLGKDAFEKIYYLINENLETRTVLEQQLFNKFKISIKDVSEPGTFKINVLETLYFLEQKYYAKPSGIKEDFLNIHESRSGHLNIADTDNNDLPTSSNEQQEQIEKLASKVRQSISRGQIDIAFKDLSAFINNNKAYNDLENDLILISSRYNSLKRDERLGTISFGDASLQQNRIVQALLNIIASLEKG